MAFDSASAYDRFMGHWSVPLARVTLDRLDLRDVGRVLDVGCGPGALTGVLVERLGADRVVAADPAPSFVRALGERFPGVEVHRAPAEQLPFPDDTFDACLAQLVVHFMADPDAGLREMARVTRPGGLVAASVWDFGGDRSPLSPFWEAVRETRPDVADESERAGTHEGQLVGLLEAAGIHDVVGGWLEVTLRSETFEEWWEPFTLGVGPAGDHLAGLDQDEAAALHARCRSSLGEGPFEQTAVAWYAEGRA